MSPSEKLLVCKLISALSGWMTVARCVAPVLDKTTSGGLGNLLRERIEMGRGPLEILSADPDYMAAIKEGAGL